MNGVFLSYPTVWTREDGHVRFVRAGEQLPAANVEERRSWTMRRATKQEELRAEAERVVKHVGEHYEELVYLIKQDRSLRTFVRDALSGQVSQFLKRSNDDGSSKS